LRTGPETILGQVLSRNQVVQIPDLAATRGYAERSPIMVAAVELGGVRTYLAVPMFKENKIIGAVLLYRQEVRPFNDNQVALLTNFASQAAVAIENTRLLSELRESLERQTATSEVLKVISSSPGDLEPVFNAMLANATRICEAIFGTLYMCEGPVFRVVATHSKEIYSNYLRSNPVVDVREHPGIPLDRLANTKQVVHIPDFRTDQSYLSKNARMIAFVESVGVRTILAVPMLKEDELVGAILIYRQEVRPFTDKQIDLVKNFAAQAVIAIENTRLLNELRQRTVDLSESLQQQTATSEVLKVISSSPGDLEPVFETILRNAVRICDAKLGSLFLSEGEDKFRTAALYGAPPAFAESRRRDPFLKATPASGLGRVAATKQAVQILDVREDPAYANNPTRAPLIELAGARTLINVPMLKNDELVGQIGIYRQEVRPFTEKQIELLANFAAQAVIAIENARLLNELKKLNLRLEQRVEDQVGEIERMGRLRRFLPPQVADLIIASGTEKQLDSHRREITALFCDLRGFTGFSESSDPEDVMALLRDYHAAIGEIIIKYSGTLERYAGDGVMVVFNDPVPVDNPALQAVLMALEMRGAIGALTEKWRRLGHDIGFGIGIAHGFATLGTIGFEGRFDYAAIGTVSNVASRLCDEAKPGQILISPRVLMAVEKVVTVELVGEFALKGIRRPLAAHNVLAANSANQCVVD
jgi:GAF domain-containing protein